MTATVASFDSLLAVVERALDDEKAALMEADGDALIKASSDKRDALVELQTRYLGGQNLRLSAPDRRRLLDAMVANERNRALLSVLSNRIGERMQRLGLLGVTYGPRGDRGLSRRATAMRSA